MKGILMRPAMHRAEEEGLKTVTRRLDGLKEINLCPDHWTATPTMNANVWAFLDFTESERINIKPRYRVGEVVYIKEVWCLVNYGYLAPDSVEVIVGYNKKKWDEDREVEESSHTIDKATWDKYRGNDKWRSPLFMPAWVARHFIQITGVGPERLQEITAEDTVKEGVTGMSYQPLWDSINPKYPWSSNPWVWRYEFKKVPKPDIEVRKNN